MRKELCDCGNVAVWCYLPGNSNPYSCDECVYRGCSCNEYSVVAEHYHPPGGIIPNPEADGTEGIDWKWINTEKTLWARIDEKGRRYPCCEYDYDAEGYEIEEDENRA